MIKRSFSCNPLQVSQQYLNVNAGDNKFSQEIWKFIGNLPSQGHKLKVCLTSQIQNRKELAIQWMM